MYDHKSREPRFPRLPAFFSPVSHTKNGPAGPGGAAFLFYTPSSRPAAALWT